MEHFITTKPDKHRNKIEKHLGKYINVHSPAWVIRISIENSRWNVLIIAIWQI